MLKTIVFQGDSITDAGRSRTTKKPNRELGNGYVNLIASELLYAHPELVIYNRGVSGNRIGDMYARWIEDTLNLKPDLLSVLNGINDVGFGLRLGMGATAEKYRRIYDVCLEEAKAQNPDLTLVLLEPFILRVNASWAEFGDDIYQNYPEWRKQVEERAIVTRELAEKYHARFVPLQHLMDEALDRAPAAHWSLDCIHPTVAGAKIVAKAFLEATKDLFPGT